MNRSSVAMPGVSAGTEERGNRRAYRRIDCLVDGRHVTGESVARRPGGYSIWQGPSRGLAGALGLETILEDGAKPPQ